MQTLDNFFNAKPIDDNCTENDYMKYDLKEHIDTRMYINTKMHVIKRIPIKL